MTYASATVAPSWEAQKENAAPLERGRNVASLGLHQSDLVRQELNKMVQHYETLVSSSEDPNVTQVATDPLADWMSYIKFYQNSFPSDTRENFLVIERCVRALMKMKQYSNDDRFVSICAKYADKTKDPGQVFRYLHQQKIGSHTALFWIAWAFVAEKESDFLFAEQIFKKGISKRAEPIQMLTLRHQQFQRRMSRHWLNSSKTNDQVNDEYDMGDQNRSSRSTLGGISSDCLHRGNRSQNRVCERRQNGSRRFGTNQSNNNITQKGSFNIFVEEEGSSAYDLDQEYTENVRTVIARESDRRKENILNSERWNERGGIHHNHRTSKALAPRNKTPLPAFSVFVDEECAAKNERQEEQQHVHKERQRQVRDERTFRERDSEAMAEKIFRDPVRFLKDPTRYKSENVLEGQRSEEDLKGEKTKTQRKSRAGFNKRLLKSENEEEQCFEEARAKAGMFNELVGSSMNFNRLQNPICLNMNSKTNYVSDRTTSMDVLESVSEFIKCTTNTKNTIREKKFESKTKGKKFCQQLNGSFDSGLNQTAISNAGSTINSVDISCVGVSGKLEEETINTKFAMKELSMMFSSPAFESNSARRRHDYSNTSSRLDESVACIGKADVSFGSVGDGILLDNSICNIHACDEKSPYGQQSFTKDKALQELKDGNKESNNVNAGFVIFQDCSSHAENKVRNDVRSDSGSQIYDGSEDFSERITEERSGKMNSSIRFQIFEDSNDNNHETGDTASIADAIALLDEKMEINEISSMRSNENNQHKATEADETATLSLFNQIFQKDLDKQDDKINSKASEVNLSSTNGDDNRRNPEKAFNKRKVFFCNLGSTTKCLKRSYDDVQKTELDYDMCIAQNIEIALRDLQLMGDIPDCNTPLFSRLLSKGKVFHFPSITLPRQLQRKHIVSNTKVLFGKHGGLFLKQELGRGAFGRVVLIKNVDSHKRSTIAIKVQSPTDSLAWEFVVLQRLEQRILLGGKQPIDYAFPHPISFIMLTNGGLLSMSAVSETGLNLIDLSNFYTLKQGKSVPELIAFHYISVALRIIEQLHWHGKILHCDVKPDNFVLSDFRCSNTVFSKINFSELTLVDFGNAVDLAQNSNFDSECAKNKLFYGNPARKEMQCIAMRNGQSWSHDADTFGILCCAHVLLYGKHIQIKMGKDNRWMPSTSLKRYWKRDLWKEIFDTLLNQDGNAGLSICSQASCLRGLRQKIDTHLTSEARNLHNLLSWQANCLPGRRENIV